MQSLDITEKTTATELPWSNGIDEKQNLVLQDMLDKIIEYTHTALTEPLPGASML